MVPVVCPTCRAEAPEGSRYCSACGQPLVPSALDGDLEAPRPLGEVPSLGHEVRASSPDRRVQTSPVGTVLPVDVLSALAAASADSQGSASSRRDNTPRRMAPASSPRPAERAVPRAVADEPTVPISYRAAKPRSIFRLLRSLLYALLWLLLSGLVAMAVIWVLPDRPLPGPAVTTLPVLPPSRSEPTKASRPAVKTVPVVPPLAAPAVPVPTDVARDAPSTGSLPAAAGPASQITSGAGASAAAPPDAASLLRGAERAAWLQDLANIEFVATTYAAQVRACYERAIRGLAGEPPAGRVSVLFVLSDDGHVQSAAVFEDSLGLPVLGACLSQRLTEWRFPRPVGPLRTFRFPFVFAGAKP
jgi:hypothetical protein